MNAIAITGIHTGVGKTIASAILAQALGADYWKPVQAGDVNSTDSMLVEQLITNGTKRVHQEAIILSQPMSPHAAAAIDNVTIDFTKFIFPTTNQLLLIETAGGVLSPMTEQHTMADFVQHYQLPTILISGNYLGSINHTLLSIEALKRRDIPILGVVISGTTNEAIELFIESYGGIPIIARIPNLSVIDAVSISLSAQSIQQNLLKQLPHAFHITER